MSNNLQGNMFNISILFLILKVFLFSEEENYQWVVLLIKAQLSDQLHMGLVTWRISVIIKSGDNSRTTHIITIIAFHIPKTQIVLNMCD